MMTRLPYPALGAIAALSVFAGLALGACQKAAPPQTQAPAATATAPTPDADAQAPAQDAAAPSQWSQMNHAQQLVYMKEVVTPQMAQLFQAYDAQEFANFSCATCHGPSAAQGEFEMPTAALPRLGDFEVAKQEHPKGMAFMMEKVTPQMAKLLHMPAFDPATQKGFGCFGCHLPAQAEG